MSETDHFDHADHPDSPGLRRRLADAVATATFDEERAWAEIQERISSVPPGGGRRPLDLGRVPRRAVAAAAVVVLVLGALLWFGGDDDGGRVVTQDSTTTTAGGGTTSTTRDGTSTTTPSTTVGDGEAPETTPGAGGTTPDGQPAPGSGGAGAGSGSGGGGGTGTTSPPGTATATTSPPVATAGDGRPPAVTLSTSAYTVWGTAWASGGNYSMNLWGPELGTYLDAWSWSGNPGRNCLEAGSSSLTGSDGRSHALVWGLVRADAAGVRVVTTGNLSSSAVLGSEVVPGLRPWIAEAPRGQVDRAEALDGAGGVLHTSTSPAWLTTPDTC